MECEKIMDQAALIPYALPRDLPIGNAWYRCDYESELKGIG